MTASHVAFLFLGMILGVEGVLLYERVVVLRLLQAADRAADSGKIDEQLVHLTALVARDPSPVHRANLSLAYLLRAQNELDQRNPEVALQHFDLAVSYAPDWPIVYQEYAEALDALDEPRVAEYFRERAANWSKEGQKLE